MVHKLTPPSPSSSLIGQMASVLDEFTPGSGRRVSGVIVQSRSTDTGLDMMVDAARIKLMSKTAGHFRIGNSSSFLFRHLPIEEAQAAITAYSSETASGSDETTRRNLGGHFHVDL
jgi:hypothetical protein